MWLTVSNSISEYRMFELQAGMSEKQFINRFPIWKMHQRGLPFHERPFTPAALALSLSTNIVLNIPVAKLRTPVNKQNQSLDFGVKSKMFINLNCCQWERWALALYACLSFASACIYLCPLGSFAPARALHPLLPVLSVCALQHPLAPFLPPCTICLCSHVVISSFYILDLCQYLDEFLIDLLATFTTDDRKKG